jgi:hypothetical protein
VLLRERYKTNGRVAPSVPAVLVGVFMYIYMHFDLVNHLSHQVLPFRP